MQILGIETSCDETAVAVVDATPSGLCIVSNVVHSQVATHARWGGVVPEVASREHVARIVAIAEAALAPAGGLDRIEGIGVTQGPGLVGSLLVGLQFAKGIALARGIPWVGVNHLEGHLSAALLATERLRYPHLALVVSGGHSELYRVASFGAYVRLGGTRDDAAGEAFDKIAKVLGLGYPGGVAIERAAQGGDARVVALPRALPQKTNAEFSFSGLKTAAAKYVRAQGGRLEGDALRDFCAAVQEAIADVLSAKAVTQATLHGLPGIVLAGGVAANTRLRELVQERAQAHGLWAFIPEKKLCTDNGAMIAAAAAMRLHRGERGAFDAPPLSRWPLGRDAQGRIAALS